MLITLIRTIILYVVVIVGVRIMGKRQVGEMQPAELVVTILISELAAIPMQDLDRPMANGVIAIFGLVIFEILLSIIIMKSLKLRRIISGKPAIIINNGVIDQHILKELRITIDDLNEDLRQAGVFSFDEVQFAILETNGKISVLKKPHLLGPTAEQMHVENKDKGLPCTVICDGVIEEHSLPLVSFTAEKIHSILEQNQLKLKDVFIMTADKLGNHVIVKKQKKGN
ncbi:MAG: hypothetical protein BGN88_05050 [Clostridiales bacterium 43-6]|nr:MAG: hypothetical protein BGN88_05050 [Clostridiales bacterium 43-6]